MALDATVLPSGMKATAVIIVCFFGALAHRHFLPFFLSQKARLFFRWSFSGKYFRPTL
jgi:hypothetical protein